MTLVSTIERPITLNPDLAIRNALRRLSEILRAWQRRRRHRAAMRTLLSQDDRMLDDVGLTRHEVERGARLTQDVNATRAVRNWRIEARLRD